MMEKKLKDCVFFVQASDFERHLLWERHHESAPWEQDTVGVYRTIGHVNGKRHQPIVVHFSFAMVHGQRVCFYEATSRYVDHNKVEEYIERNYPVFYDGDRRAMTSAGSFHQALHWCRRLGKGSGEDR